MEGARAWFVVAAALGMGSKSLGLTCLEHPQNVTVHVINAHITLKWDWDNPCGLNVTYSVEFQSYSTGTEIWAAIPQCQKITITECDLSSTIQNYLETYNVTVRVNTVKNHSPYTSLEFIPYLEAQVGPPEVWFESIYGDVKINILQPETDQQKMWKLDRLTYELTIWKNATHPEVKITKSKHIANLSTYLQIQRFSLVCTFIEKQKEIGEEEGKLVLYCFSVQNCPDSSPHTAGFSTRKKYKYILLPGSGTIIYDLEPETTYCLKVKACVADHSSFYSPVHCMQTSKAWIGLPRPENLQIHSLNMKHLLYWDNLYDGNVSFVVQFLPGYKLNYSPDVSKDWKNASGCENTPTTFCDLSSSIGSNGIYYLRVQAMNSHNKSPWSKNLKFVPIQQNKMGPPNVSINASENSINVFIASPGESENNAMSAIYTLTYHVWYWTASSFVKKELKHKPSQFIISNLTSSTLYCLQVQAFTEDYKIHSAFSKVTCVKTAEGNPSYQVPVITASVMAFIICFISAIYCAWKKVKYAFFPKCKPPTIIENIGEDVNRLYLLPVEEQTDECMVINSNAAPGKVNLDDFKFEKELEQISQDSENYFIDDIIISGD